jgi:hypothetical protein
VTQPPYNTISSAVPTSAGYLRICEGVGQGCSSLPYVPHALAQMLAKSTLPPELVIVEVQPEQRQRKPSLARLIAKAKQLGVDVTVEPNGAVTFRCGSAAPDAVINEWDEVLPRHGTH